MPDPSNQKRLTASEPPSNRELALLACLGSALMLAALAIGAYAVTHSVWWAATGVAGEAALLTVAYRSWRHVSAERRDDEDEDGIDEDGGGGSRLPPDPPDDDGNLRIDWDAFERDFWQHVDSELTEV